MSSALRKAFNSAASMGAAYARAMSTVPSTMRAAVIRETGPVECMKVEADYPTPELQAGQALVKNQFSGINFIDTYHRSGLYARELPFIGGQEGGGIVAATTPEAEAQVWTWDCCEFGSLLLLCSCSIWTSSAAPASCDALIGNCLKTLRTPSISDVAGHQGGRPRRLQLRVPDLCRVYCRACRKASAGPRGRASRCRRRLRCPGRKSSLSTCSFHCFCVTNWKYSKLLFRPWMG